MKFATCVLFVAIILTLIVLFPKTVSASEILKPTLEWKRSTEAQAKIATSQTLGGGVSAALTLPLDDNQTVFDNGVFTGVANKAVIPAGTQWASWPLWAGGCGARFETRHLRATFNLPAGLTVKKVLLASPYYTDPIFSQVFPINDNAYIFLNGQHIATLGTSYGAINRGFNGTAPIANETDGWIANGDLGSSPANNLHAGENILDIVTEEWCLWGGMGNVELKLEVQGTVLNVPYFNQTVPPWGPQEYDHANTKGPFFCGRTIAQCGCALTSTAMLLKYYGVDKTPTGQPTTPETLNNWLKTRGGYSYGSVVWPFIQTYSQEAKPKNELQTNVLKWVGFGPSKEKSGQTILNSYLNREIPVILEEPNHFVISKGISGSTYLINDPRWPDRTTLEFYANTFSGMRLFEPTHTDLSTIYIVTPAPTDILLIDSQGRKVGKDPNTGVIYTEIPNSSYFLEPALVDDSIEDAPLPPASAGVTTLSIVNPEQGNFNIQTSGFEGNYSITFYGFDINGEPSMQELQPSVTPGTTQEFQLHYSQEPGFQIAVTQIVDIDIKPGSNPNSVNSKSNGVIPVAIFTTPSFDATQVDVATVRFGPSQVKETHNKGHLEDVDGDSDIDMVLHFKTQETGIQNTDTQACLTGTTLSGVPIQGCDSVRIVGK